MPYNITTNSKVVHGTPCKTCGSDLRVRDSGLCVKCNPIKQKTPNNEKLIERRRAIEAHQHRNDPYY